MNFTELGRRAVACKHFYWMPGMLLSNGRRVGVWTPGEVCGSSETSPQYDGAIHPDLSDPATLGCLLALVREAWPDEWAKHVVPIWDGRDSWSVGCLNQWPGGTWFVFLVDIKTNEPISLASTEAEALVTALEAAP